MTHSFILRIQILKSLINLRVNCTFCSRLNTMLNMALVLTRHISVVCSSTIHILQYTYCRHRLTLFLLSSLITANTWPGGEDWSQALVLLISWPPGISSQAETESGDTTPSLWGLPGAWGQGMSLSGLYISQNNEIFLASTGALGTRIYVPPCLYVCQFDSCIYV